jgi:hypothetical protein
MAADPCTRPPPLPWQCFQLPLAPQVCLELGEDPEHVEEALAGGRAGIDRLLGRLQTVAAGPHGANDVLKVSDAPGEAIDAGDAALHPTILKTSPHSCVHCGTTLIRTMRSPSAAA